MGYYQEYQLAEGIISNSKEYKYQCLPIGRGCRNSFRLSVNYNENRAITVGKGKK